MKFRRKPVVVEAMQFTDADKNRLFNWISCNRSAEFDGQGKPVLKIQTLVGVLTAYLGDWVIRDVKGEFYPCKPDIFAEIYEPAE
jgi:hypothetical protein